MGCQLCGNESNQPSFEYNDQTLQREMIKAPICNQLPYSSDGSNSETAEDFLMSIAKERRASNSPIDFTESIVKRLSQKGMRPDQENKNYIAHQSTVSFNEKFQSLLRAPKDEFDEVFKSLNPDKDGNVDYEQFVAFAKERVSCRTANFGQKQIDGPTNSLGKSRDSRGTTQLEDKYFNFQELDPSSEIAGEINLLTDDDAFLRLIEELEVD